MSAVTDLVVEHRDRAGSAGRRRANFVLFLGPAIALTFLFFVIPVLIDIAVSFTDLDRTLRISKFTAEQYQKVFVGDRRLPLVIGLTFVYAFGTLAVFNVRFGLVLALTTAWLNKIAGGFFRSVWLLPRVSPSILYILLWLWMINLGRGPVEPVPHTFAQSDQATGFDDERAGRADHHRQWLYRRIARYDHLYCCDTGHSRAHVPCRRSRRRRHLGKDQFHYDSGAEFAPQLWSDSEMTTPLTFIDIHSRSTAPVDWDRMAARARALGHTKALTLYAFLIAVSLPIILPYSGSSRSPFRREPASPTPWFCSARWPCFCPQ
jgi:hypothetical protein